MTSHCGIVPYLQILKNPIFFYINKWILVTYLWILKILDCNLWSYSKYRLMAPMTLYTFLRQLHAIDFEVNAWYLNLALFIIMFTRLNVHFELINELRKLNSVTLFGGCACLQCLTYEVKRPKTSKNIKPHEHTCCVLFNLIYA